MPFIFSNAKYADMVYVYGFCDGNAAVAVAEYSRQFLNHRIPDKECLPRFSTHCVKVVHFLVLTFHLTVKFNEMWPKWKTFLSWYSTILVLVHKFPCVLLCHRQEYEEHYVMWT
jgi:hypothetical protein